MQSRTESPDAKILGGSRAIRWRVRLLALLRYRNDWSDLGLANGFGVVRLLMLWDR
jgi:hypothetical protein